MADLTKKQQKIYDYIKNFIEENGYSPSIREIGDGLGLRSPATVHSHINNLVKLGVLNKDSLKNRTLSLIQNESIENRESFDSKNGIDYLEVPVVGRVAAGSPILAAQNIERVFPLPMDFARNKDIFMLKIKGDSMINVGILDGDYVIVERTDIAQNRDIIVALIDDSATVKTFYKENGYFRLQPENDNMDSIIVNELKVLGKVVGVFRLL